jgi:hypothetical protein
MSLVSISSGSAAADAPPLTPHSLAAPVPHAHPPAFPPTSDLTRPIPLSHTPAPPAHCTKNGAVAICPQVITPLKESRNEESLHLGG